MNDDSAPATPLQTPLERAQAYLGEARRHWDDDEFPQAIEAAAQAAGLAQLHGWTDVQALAACIAASAMLWTGDLAGATHHLVAAQALAEQANLPLHVAEVRVHSAMVSNAIGDYAQALADAELAWQCLESSGDLERSVRAQKTVARTHSLLGNFAHAREWLELALRAAADAGRDDLAARCAVDAAATWLDQGDRERNAGEQDAARQSWAASVDEGQRALEWLARSGERSSRSVALLNMASAHSQLGDCAAALRCLEQAEEATRDLPHSVLHDVARATERARLLCRQGNLGDAETAIAEVARQAEEAGLSQQLEGIFELWSDIAEQRGDVAHALALLKRVRVMGERMHGERARQRSQVLAARYDTERARSEAVRQLERARALEADASSLRQQALLDPLTGVANRRCLDAELVLRHAQARSRNESLFAAMLDIDHFKRVNDSFSHAIGDEVLRRVAATLCAQVRECDLVARYGGEEFTIVLGVHDRAVALKACERIRQAIQSQPWDAVAPKLVVTVSVGLSDIARHEDPTAGLARADACLYQAKRGGRNRVVLADT